MTRAESPTLPYAWTPDVLRKKAEEIHALGVDLLRIALDFSRIADELEGVGPKELTS